MATEKLLLTKNEIEIFLTYVFQLEESSTINQSIDEKVEFYTRNLYQDKMAKQKRENAQANKYDKLNDGMTLEQAKKWVIPFGKYKNQLITDVAVIDQEYIDYIYDNFTLSEKLKMAIEIICYVKHE